MARHAAWGLQRSTAAAGHGAIGRRGGFAARVVFNPKQIIEYENEVDYAARLSKPAYFHGYTAIPLGNAPWNVCRRWAKDVLKGAREGAGTGDPAKGGERQGAREDAQA